MRIILLFICSCSLLFVPNSGFSQIFPENWFGHYVGKLHVFALGSESEAVHCEIYFSESNHPDTVGFTIIYGEDSTDVRSYVIFPTNRTTGEWMIDERNGIFIPCFFQGNRLISLFDVMGVRILSVYYLVPDGLNFEMYAFGTNPITSSISKDEEALEVNAFGLNNCIEGQLKKE